MHVDNRHASSFTNESLKINSFKFILWLVCGRFRTPAAAEHSKQIFTRVYVCACKCACVEYNMEMEWTAQLEGSGKGTGRKGDQGGQLPEHNYCSNNLHPSPASSLSNDPIPTSGTGFPTRSARRSVIPKRPLPAPSENPNSEQPSLFGVSSSSPFLLQHVSNLHHLGLEVSWPSPRLSPAPQERWIKIQARQADPLSK